MNAFLVRGLYVNFHSDSLKVFAFVDAHGVWVYEDNGCFLIFYGNKLLLLLPTSCFKCYGA